MKPNDQAYQAALRATSDSCSAYQIQNALDAAYAAQFPPSEDYAGLVKELRKVEPDLPGERTRWYRNPNGPDAADALGALLAERDALKAELAAANTRMSKLDFERTAAELERDALLARLAPVEDEALLKAAAQAICDYVYVRPDDKFEFQGIARAVVAAIRPHIEAAERERCVKAVEKVAERINVAHHERPEWEDGYLQGVHDAAAAIRSGK